MKYKIKDITRKSTGETRQDGRYPMRIGSEVILLEGVVVGEPLFFRYVKYNNGELAIESHTTRTSCVYDFDGYSKPKTLYVYTRNSVYEFVEIEE